MIYTLDEIEQVAEKIIREAQHKVVLFYGQMGAGKTTLIKCLCEKLGVKDVSNSPTFSLVNEYQDAEHKPIYHFDFYRIEDEEEAYDIGFEDYLYSGNWCFIEWAENVENLLPVEHVKLTITLLDDKRKIEIKNT